MVTVLISIAAKTATAVRMIFDWPDIVLISLFHRPLVVCGSMADTIQAPCQTQKTAKNAAAARSFRAGWEIQPRKTWRISPTGGAPVYGTHGRSAA
jgi:ABC-type sulfate transport system permease subunit